MKFGQLIEYNKINIFFSKNHAEIEVGRLVPDPFFVFFKKALYNVKTTGLLGFTIF